MAGDPPDHVIRHWNRLLERIECAVRRSERAPGTVQFVAVSKGVEQEAIDEAFRAGARQFGESRVHEAMDKFSDKTWASWQIERSSVSLHLIGSLQTNKVKKAVGFFDLMHSMDSVGLAEKVASEAAARSLVQPVLVQVNVANEAAKRGVSVSEAPFLIDRIRACPSLRLDGLMTIPPRSLYPEASRPYFAKLRELGVAHGLHQFSMGMSNDFEVAIEEGATWVRIGTALFE